MFGQRNRAESNVSSKRLAVVFVRHGDTTANEGEGGEELVRGQHDYPLDQHGKEEAASAGRSLARHGGVARVYSSPLSRGRDTASLIAKATDSAVTVTRALLPWDKGNAEGKPVSKEDPKLREYALDKPTTPVPGGESFHDFTARTDAAARSIVNAGKASVKSGKGPVAAVSHSVDMRRLHHSIEGKPAGDPLTGGAKPGEMIGVTVGEKVKRLRPGMWGSK